MKIAKRRITRFQFEAAKNSKYFENKRRKDVYQSTSKFQQAFKNWFDEARHRIAIPLSIRQKSARFIKLSFDHYPAALEVWITPGDISVAVIWHGMRVDLLVSIDMVIPVYHLGPYGKGVIICDACAENEHQIQYATLNQFWVEHLFEDFAQWVNETLAPAAWLSIHKVEGGSWAKLHKELPVQKDTTLCILALPQRTIP